MTFFLLKKKWFTLCISVSFLEKIIMLLILYFIFTISHSALMKLKQLPLPVQINHNFHVMKLFT